MTNKEKGLLYQSYLDQYDKKRTELRNLEVDLQPKDGQQKKISLIREEMLELQKKAEDLVKSSGL